MLSLVILFDLWPDPLTDPDNDVLAPGGIPGSFSEHITKISRNKNQKKERKKEKSMTSLIPRATNMNCGLSVHANWSVSNSMAERPLCYYVCILVVYQLRLEITLHFPSVVSFGANDNNNKEEKRKRSAS